MCLENSGVVSLEWSLTFPNEQDIDLESWADVAEFSDEQVHYNYVLDNQIFSISPRKGSLQPSEKVFISLTYRHSFTGGHRLPILFKLKNGPFRTGKSFMIIFAGSTVGKEKVYIHLPISQYSLASAALGSNNFPAQSLRLYNPGQKLVEYAVGLEYLSLVSVFVCPYINFKDI